MNIAFYKSVAVASLVLFLSACAHDGSSSAVNTQPSGAAPAKTASTDLPSLVVSEDPTPEVIYNKNARDAYLADPATPTPRMSDTGIETPVTRRAEELRHDFEQLQGGSSSLEDQLRSLQSKNDTDAASYYEVIASVNTELQAGSTPGNPYLLNRWNMAQERLERLSQNAGVLNDLASSLAEEASKAAFLQENIRGAYSLSGAVKDDHKKLRAIEDDTNAEIAKLGRLLTSVNDEINRRASYLRSERLNLQTLSLAIENGELYGRSLTNSLYKKVAEEGQTLSGANPSLKNRPLVVIRFDKPNVKYEQALYDAVGQALEKYPAAKFNLVALSPTAGNPAQKALASTEARKNGEAVLRSLAQMGLPMERVDLSAADSNDVKNSEVRLYIR